MGAREFDVMRVQGEANLRHARWDVWAALNDPVLLCRCIPDCESIEHLTRDMLLVRLSQHGQRVDGLGRRALIEAADHMPPEHLRATVRCATPAGSVEAQVRVTLLDRGRFTILAYEIDLAGTATHDSKEPALRSAVSWTARRMIANLMAVLERC